MAGKPTISPSSTRFFPHEATNVNHEGVTAMGGTSMQEQTTRSSFRASVHQIERLYLDLAEFNRQIEGLEKLQADTQTTEILKASAYLRSRLMKYAARSLPKN